MHSWRCACFECFVFSNFPATRRVCEFWATLWRAAPASWAFWCSRWLWPLLSSLRSCSTQRRMLMAPISYPFPLLFGTPSSPWRRSGKSQNLPICCSTSSLVHLIAQLEIKKSSFIYSFFFFCQLPVATKESQNKVVGGVGRKRKQIKLKIIPILISPSSIIF